MWKIGVCVCFNRDVVLDFDNFYRIVFFEEFCFLRLLENFILILWGIL